MRRRLLAVRARPARAPPAACPAVSSPFTKPPARRFRSACGDGRERIVLGHGLGADGDQVPERAVTLGGTLPRELLDALHAEPLDGERGTHDAVDERPPQVRVVGVAAAREVAEEAAGERVARAGRILDLLQREGRRPEGAALGEEHGAVLASLHDEGARAELEDLTRSAQDAE